MRHQIIKINNMHCKSCGIVLQQGISQLTGVKEVRVSYEQGQAEITSDPDLFDQVKVKELVESYGYAIG